MKLLDAATSGIGVYTLAEAARYAKMPAATIGRWFYGTKTLKPMRPGTIRDDAEKAISFLDFVEALAVRSLRVDYKLPMGVIRDAIDFARKEYAVDHPFARRDHRTVLVGRQLFIHLSEDPENPVAISGRDAGQKSFRPCIEAYMTKLVFDDGGLAKLYVPFTFEAQKVIMNPKLQYGEPVIAENGFPADVLWRAAVAEGGFERAAKLFDVSAQSVEAAYRYCNEELGMAAA